MESKKSVNSSISRKRMAVDVKSEICWESSFGFIGVPPLPWTPLVEGGWGSEADQTGLPLMRR